MCTLPDDMTDAKARAAFAAFAPEARAGLLALRRLILTIAAENQGIGPIEETTRWGQPAYIAAKGSTLRLGVPKAGGYALFVICTTTLIEDFRVLAGDGFRFEGTRAVLFCPGEPVDTDALALLIRAALTYHQR